MKPIDLEQFEGHTPGPWNWQLVDEDDPDWQLCEVYWGDIDENADDSAGGYIATGGIGIANARLIAAAPTLLAELKALRRWRAEVLKIRDGLKESLEYGFGPSDSDAYKAFDDAWNVAERELENADV